jgi:hypothetical protein
MQKTLSKSTIIFLREYEDLHRFFHFVKALKNL